MGKRTVLVTMIVGLGATLVVSRAGTQAKQRPVRMVMVAESDLNDDRPDQKIRGLRTVTVLGQSLNLKYVDEESVKASVGDPDQLSKQFTAIDLQALKEGDQLLLAKKKQFRVFVIEDGDTIRSFFAAAGDVTIARDYPGFVSVSVRNK